MCAFLASKNDHLSLSKFHELYRQPSMGQEFPLRVCFCGPLVGSEHRHVTRLSRLSFEVICKLRPKAEAKNITIMEQTYMQPW